MSSPEWLEGVAVLCGKCGIDLPNDSCFCGSCGRARGVVSVGAVACCMLSVMLLLSPVLADTPPDGAVDQKVVGLVQRAEDLCQTERSKEAEPLLSEAAEMRPDFPDTYRVWGCAYENEDQFSKAEEKYKKW